MKGKFVGDDIIRFEQKIDGEDKEMQEAMDKSGKVIFYKILEKRRVMQEQNYNPKTLVIWDEYYNTLKYDRNLQYCADPVDFSKPQMIVGLQIITTKIPDTLEVY